MRDSDNACSTAAARESVQIEGRVCRAVEQALQRTRSLHPPDLCPLIGGSVRGCKFRAAESRIRPPVSMIRMRLREMTKTIRFALICLSMPLSGCLHETRSSRYLIPSGYKGTIQVEYGVKDAPPLPLEHGRYLIKIPSSGILRTSTALPEGVHDPEDFYYVSGNTRVLLHVKDEPYPVGTTPPQAMVRGGGVGVSGDGPVTQDWEIGPVQ
jgi:hypothetical protein